MFSDHPSLNEVWKKKLLVELKKFNKRDKQTYNFRQFIPNDCSVICYSPFVRPSFGHGPVNYPGGPSRPIFPPVGPIGPEPVSILGVYSTLSSESDSGTEKPGNGKPLKPGSGASTEFPKITSTGNCVFFVLNFQIH